MLVNKGIPISNASFPSPFYAGLEYSSPARGCWNIVHTGMLIPESHQIFVCAYGCLRGVVLTAAEMGALDRYSSICIKEENVLDGHMEDLMIEGVENIIHQLPYSPKAILIFISCQHFFLAYDQNIVFKTLREKFPNLYFTDCYMIPTLRKSGLTPDQKMRMQLFSFWKKAETINPKKINFIGSNLEVDPKCEMIEWLEKNEYECWNLQRCKTFEEYLQMSDATLNICTEPLALKSMEKLKKDLGMNYLYLSFSYDYKEIEENYNQLASTLGIPPLKFDIQIVEEAWKHAYALIQDTEISLDYTFTFRTLSFAKALVMHGFHLKRIYIDAFLPEDEGNFKWLQENKPDIMIFPTNNPTMRFVHDAKKCLAIGQKAAYFDGTNHFVNIAESGGLYGYKGMIKICSLMEEAFLHEKDRKEIIQRKGYGCNSLL